MPNLLRRYKGKKLHQMRTYLLLVVHCQDLGDDGGVPGLPQSLPAQRGGAVEERLISVIRINSL